jgi:hypothetical protein
MPLIEAALGYRRRPEMSKSTEMSLENNQRSMDKVAVLLPARSRSRKLQLQTHAEGPRQNIHSTEKEISMTKWNGKKLEQRIETETHAG